MKHVFDIASKKPTSPRHSVSSRENDSNLSQPIFSASRKIKSPIPKLPTSSQLSSSSSNFSHQSPRSSEDKIHVYLRMRPSLQAEKTYDYSIENNSIKLRPPSASTSAFCVDKSFSFRKILDSASSQEDVFESVALPLLPDFLEGDDVLIFCYGSTNAGKTFTVSGTPNNPGILYRSLNYIVSQLSECDDKKAQLFASFVEIYNERIFDLLNISKNSESLKLGVNNDGGTEIKGAFEIPIQTINDVKMVVQKAESGRHKGFTELNCDSSRSHTIFQLKLRRKKAQSTFSIVDLAGSERLSTINSSKGSFKEACNINKSMLVLGKCIRYLKEQNASPAKRKQIPYRESKLTHLFKTFFEPTIRPSKAAMIINVSPSLVQIDDTLFAMQFAATASLCAIRQVERKEPEPESESESYEEEEDIIFDQSEPYDEIETRVATKVRKEMDLYLSNVEKNLKRHYEKVSSLNQKITSARNPPNSQSFDPVQLLQNKNLIAELQSILNGMKNKNSKIENENENITFQINENNESTSNIQTINKKISEKNEELRKTISTLEAKNEEIRQSILFETQMINQKEPPIYPLSNVISLPPKIVFDVSYQNTKKETQTESSEATEYHPVIRVVLPPPK